VLIIGAGMAGGEAAGVAVGMGAQVTILARSESARAALSARFGGAVSVRGCDAATLAESAAQSDVIIGAVLDRGKLSPKLVTRGMLRAMRPRSVLIDIGIDQGGIAETSRQTTISAPTFVAEGIIHYGVPNIPALVPRTATMALTQATLPYVQAMADGGIGPALAADCGLRAGLQTCGGRITHEGLAADAGEACVEPVWDFLVRGDELQYNPAAASKR
jgi:alanine dehydrogenase